MYIHIKSFHGICGGVHVPDYSASPAGFARALTTLKRGSNSMKCETPGSPDFGAYPNQIHQTVEVLILVLVLVPEARVPSRICGVGVLSSRYIDQRTEIQAGMA